MTWAKWSIQQHNNTSIFLPLNYGHELVFMKLNGYGWLRDLWMRWLQDPMMGGLKLKLTHNDRDKGGHDAQYLEAPRKFSFSHFTQGTAFFSYDRAV